jgi:CubicO group peptidase (beta-lactamase class C family)
MKSGFSKSLVVLTIIIVLGIILMPGYLRKALIYGHVGIDDYTIFQNRIIKKGHAIAWNNHKNYNRATISAPDSIYFRQFGTVAFLVVKNDSILFEEYWDGYSDSSYSNSFSMAKSIISLLIGCLYDEGKIKSLDQPVSDFLEESQDTRLGKIHIRDLLTMSSGLDWDEAYSSAFSKTTQAYYGNDLAKLVTRLETKSAPGKIFNYQSCDTQLLGMIIEKASGKHISDYASEKLWQPLGAEHDAIWSLDRKNGLEKAYCCFNSNARDFARIGQMILDSGQFSGRQILSSSYIRQAASPASWLKDKYGKSCDYYGYHIWMLNYKGMKVTYARGILGQYIFMIPAKNMVIVRLGTKRDEKKIGSVPEDVFRYLDIALKIDL